MEENKIHIIHFNDILEIKAYINDRKVGREDIIATFPIDRKLVFIYYG